MISSERIYQYLREQNYSVSCQGGPLPVRGFCSLSHTKKNAVSWIKSGKACDLSEIRYAEQILWIMDQKDGTQYGGNYHIIRCRNPKEVFFEIIRAFFTNEEEAYICPDSVIDTDRIGKNVSIGHHCYIGRDVVIEDHVVIKNNVSIECPAVIGEGSMIHSGVVIGGDGFGYYRKESGAVRKVPHLGGVVIGRDVEIGACSCIDRGTIDDTVIGNHVKIDNLCHIAHNVTIGAHSMVVALSLLGGSSVLEENAYIAPGVTVRNQVRIGENAVVGMGAVVTKDVEKNKVMIGVPARPIENSAEK